MSTNEVEDQSHRALLDMFAQMNPQTILAVLRKNNGDLEASAGELLEISTSGVKREEEERMKRFKDEELQKKKELEEQALKEQQQFLSQSKIERIRMEEKKQKQEQRNAQLAQSLSASTTLVELNKVYERSFAVMEQKIKEQAVELRDLREEIEDRDQRIKNLEEELQNLRTQEQQKNSATDSISEVISSIKENIDGGIPDQINVDFMKLSGVIKKELALSFLRDYQASKAGTDKKDMNTMTFSSLMPSVSPAIAQNREPVKNNDPAVAVSSVPSPVPSAPAVISPMNPMNPMPHPSATQLNRADQWSAPGQGVPNHPMMPLPVSITGMPSNTFSYGAQYPNTNPQVMPGLYPPYPYYHSQSN